MSNTAQPGVNRNGAPTVTDVLHQLTTLQTAERFFDSIVLFALLEGGVLDVLADGPADLETITRRLSADRRVLRATLDAAVALGMLTSEHEQFAAGDAILDVLARPESGAYLADFIRFLHSLVGPLALLGQQMGATTRHEPGADGTVDTREARGPSAQTMGRAMQALTRAHGHELLHRIDWTSVRHLLDIGSGPGANAFMLLDAFPEMRVTLVDRPDALQAAQTAAAARGLLPRVAFVEADARALDMPSQFDAVLLSQVLHMLSAESARDVVRRSALALQPGGHLVIHAQFLETDRRAPRWPVLLNLVEAVITPEGENHTLDDVREWMLSAGLEDIRHVPFAAWNPSSCLVGRASVSPATDTRT